MPNVVTAKTAGFCFGVNRAVDTVYDELNKAYGPVYTFGPIVHNDLVTQDLAKKGVKAINSLDELDSLEPGIIVLRAHGVSSETEKAIAEKGFKVIDATCPFVKKIHNIVRKENEQGRRVIIVGDPTHPEVIGIKGWGRQDTVIIETIEDFWGLNLPVDGKYSLVAQTTFNYEKILEIIANLRELKYDINCFNTVCNATQERQKEALEIACRVDAMIVIGSRNSSNTRKLYEICNSKCSATMLIQSLDDLTATDFNCVNSIGITAGASTPKKIIEEVQTYVRS